MEVSTQSIYIFMKQIRCQKTMKYKRYLSIKLPFLQNDENALTTFLHSTDDLGPCCWKVRKKLEEGKPLDWASAEALAFGSLLLEGKKETRGREAIGLGFSRGLGIWLPAGK